MELCEHGQVSTRSKNSDLLNHLRHNHEKKNSNLTECKSFLLKLWLQHNLLCDCGENLVPTWPLEVSGVTQEPQWACCTSLYSAFVKNNYETDKYRLPHNYSSHQNRNTDLHHISQCWNTHQSQDIYIYTLWYFADAFIQSESGKGFEVSILIPVHLVRG